MKGNAWLVSGVIALVAACGEPGDDSKNGETSGNNDDVVKINSETNSGNASTNNSSSNNVDPSSVTEQVRAGITAPEVAHDTGAAALDLVAQAVFLASELGAGSQALVTSGTLTQQGQELNFTYEASPGDRLVVAWSEGPPTELHVSAFDGDFTGDASRFVYNDHQATFRITVEGKTDLEISSTRSNGESQATMVGDVTLDDGVKYAVDVVLAGTYSYNVGMSAEHESEETFTGTITADNGFSATVNEWYRFKFLYLDNQVTNEERTSETTWTVGGSSYSLQNHHIRYETLNGWANPTDYWITQGEIFGDGTQIGTVGAEETELWIEIFADVNGERIELQTFQKKQ